MTETVKVQIKVLPEAEGLSLPQYETAHAAGMDLRAAIVEDVVLGPGDVALVTTGLQIALPEGYEAQVRP
ncbi:MAG: dUTP diphosphatase, partial [Armatimonadia bacterium]